MKRRRKSKKPDHGTLFKNIVLYVILSLFSWLAVVGLLDLIELKIHLTPVMMLGIGLLGMIIAGLVGWSKFKY